MYFQKFQKCRKIVSLREFNHIFQQRRVNGVNRENINSPSKQFEIFRKIIDHIIKDSDLKNKKIGSNTLNKRTTERETNLRK